MKLKNKNQTLVITDGTISLQEGTKKYKFEYTGYRVSPASSDNTYTYLHFIVGHSIAHIGCTKVHHEITLGYNEKHHTISVIGTHIKPGSKKNIATRIRGSFDCNVSDLLNILKVD